MVGKTLCIRSCGFLGTRPMNHTSEFGRVTQKQAKKKNVPSCFKVNLDRGAAGKTYATFRVASFLENSLLFWRSSHSPILNFLEVPPSTYLDADATIYIEDCFSCMYICLERDPFSPVCHWAIFEFIYYRLPTSRCGVTGKIARIIAEPYKPGNQLRAMHDAQTHLRKPNLLQLVGKLTAKVLQMVVTMFIFGGIYSFTINRHKPIKIAASDCFR